MQKNLIPIILLFLLQGKALAQCTTASNIISFVHNGTSYEIIKELKTWPSAAACAVERGGHLVHINDSAEQAAIYNAINTSGISTTYVSVTDGGGVAYIWIGATDKLTEGTWIWDGNNDSTGANFWQGEGSVGSGGGNAVGGAYNNWGSPLTSSIPNEPDDYNNNQDAAAIGLIPWPASTSTKYGYAGEWNDINISNQLYYIIEKQPSNVGQNIPDNHIINVYPNPVSDVLHISCASCETGTFSLYSISGLKLMEGNINSTINVSAYPYGQYLLHLITSHTSIVRKVLIH